MKALGVFQILLALTAVSGGIYILMKHTDKGDSSNFSGGDDEKMLIAENNYPFGEYFQDPVGITVKSKPFYRRHGRTYN
jgi:hypothetical protein